MSKITKEQFLNAEKKYPASNWIKFGFEYFSKSTLPDDVKIKKITTIVLVVLFILLMIGGFINISMSIMIIPIILYCVIIFGLALYMLSVTLLNNRRLNKIYKELGIDNLKYQNLVNLYQL